MRTLSRLGVGLSLVFGCLLMALAAEIYYLFWWRKRKPNSGVAECERDADPLIIRSSSLPLQGVLDYLGRPLSSRSTAGGWTSTLFVIWGEMAERCACFGISSNLITYLTGPLGQSTPSAAANVNAWNGVASMLPLIAICVASYRWFAGNSDPNTAAGGEEQSSRPTSGPPPSPPPGNQYRAACLYGFEDA